MRAGQERGTYYRHVRALCGKSKEREDFPGLWTLKKTVILQPNLDAIPKANYTFWRF